LALFLAAFLALRLADCLVDRLAALGAFLALVLAGRRGDRFAAVEAGWLAVEALGAGAAGVGATAGVGAGAGSSVGRGSIHPEPDQPISI
jgi:hypothetical protein